MLTNEGMSPLSMIHAYEGKDEAAALFFPFLWVGKSLQFPVAFSSLNETDVCLFTVNILFCCCCSNSFSLVE